MATQREIRKRIKSVSSTKKITKTMEMISTSKMKKMQIRLQKSKPYEKKLEQVICTLFDSGLITAENSLLKTSKIITKKLVLMITGNRGLCGGYNTNVIINNTLSFKNELQSNEKTDVLLQLVGKKGINFFKFINQPIYKSEINLEDKVSIDDARRLSSELIEMFNAGEISEVYVSHNAIISSASYKPAVYKLLPISIEDIQKKLTAEQRTGLRQKYILEPDPDKMLSDFLPIYITLKIYLSLLESGYAEQNARRVAMKNATDAADEMVRNLTIKYNRARQAKITNEIAEIVSGASALE